MSLLPLIHGQRLLAFQIHDVPTALTNHRGVSVQYRLLHSFARGGVPPHREAVARHIRLHKSLAVAASARTILYSVVRLRVQLRPHALQYAQRLVALRVGLFDDSTAV